MALQLGHHRVVVQYLVDILMVRELISGGYQFRWPQVEEGIPSLEQRSGNAARYGTCDVPSKDALVRSVRETGT